MCFECCGPFHQIPVWNYSPPVPLVPTYHGRVIPGYAAVTPMSMSPSPLFGRGTMPHAPVGRRTFVSPVVVPGQNHGLNPSRVTNLNPGLAPRVPVGLRRF